MEVGERIRQLRAARGLTQDELGKLIHIDGRQISRYENGKVKPTGRILRRICEHFQVSLDEVVTQAPGARPEALFQDKELFQQMLEIDRLDEEDRYVAKRLLQALLMKKQLQELQRTLTQKSVSKKKP